MSGKRERPAWLRRGGDDDIWCTVHESPIGECRCPGLEDWIAIGRWPFTDPWPDAFDETQFHLEDDD